MRVFIIVGLSLIITVAFAATKEKSVEQAQNNDAQKLFALTFVHSAIDAVCEVAKTDDERDDCHRVHWWLWKEIRQVSITSRRYNETMHRSAKGMMNRVRDHMLKFAPRDK